jgi:hypothetical protein
MQYLRMLFENLFSVKTLKELLYLGLAFPFGLAYFILLVVGFSLGGSLLILGVGFLIVAAVLALARVGGWLEALLARHLLDAEVEASLDLQYDHSRPILANVGRILTDGKAIRSVVFMGLKFPMGVLTFIITVIAVVLPLSLITTPLTYNNVTNMEIAGRIINTPLEALTAMVIGLALLPLSLMAIKGMAYIWRKVVEALLQPNYAPEKQKRKQKRDVSRLMDDYIVEDDYNYEEADDAEEVAVGLRQLLNS